MLFSEIYGNYFNAVAKILEYAANGKLTDKLIMQIVRDKAFGESIASLPELIKSEAWGLLSPDLKTPLKHIPQMPLTGLEKQWLKTIMSDERIQLFGISIEGLDDVQPLYSKDTVVYFDRYNDGDPYTDKIYIKNFQTALQAIKEKRILRMRYRNSRGINTKLKLIPYKIEYSPQDDKFRILALRNRTPYIINIARIIECKIGDAVEGDISPAEHKKRMVILELLDERNALERAMLHFSPLEKMTERIDDSRYRITIYYDDEDEPEILIRIIAFGPLVQVTEPEHLINLIKERLNMQKKLWT